MTHYEKEFPVTTTLANQIVPVPYPGRCVIDRIAAVNLSGGSIAAGINFFNRAFTGVLSTLEQIVADETGDFCELVFDAPFAVKIGDVITVSGAAVSGCNGLHRVTSIVDETHVVTNVAFSAGSFSGSTASAFTARITIPVAEQSAYLYLAMTTSPAAPGTAYTNLDPLVTNNIGVNRFIYAQFVQAGEYKLLIRSHESIGIGR